MYRAHCFKFSRKKKVVSIVLASCAVILNSSEVARAQHPLKRKAPARLNPSHPHQHEAEVLQPAPYSDSEGQRFVSGERAAFYNFDVSFGEEFPSGAWGCPGALQPHPKAFTPTIVFWRQPSYLNPQPSDSLVWGVYFGWKNTTNQDTFDDTYMRYYSIPNKTGIPLSDRLERPRISFTYAPNGLPAVAVGRDAIVRYYDSGNDPIHKGPIDYIQAAPEPGGALQWHRETIPFGTVFNAYENGLEYPHLVFDDVTGNPIVSAIGYHSDLDDPLPPTNRNYENLFLARKMNSGEWMIQNVTNLLNPLDFAEPVQLDPEFYEVHGSGSVGVGHRRFAAGDDELTFPSKLGIAEEQGSASQEASMFELNPISGTLGSLLPKLLKGGYNDQIPRVAPKARYVHGYPSMVVLPGSQGDRRLRLSLAIGQRNYDLSEPHTLSAMMLEYSLDTDAFDLSSPLKLGSMVTIQTKTSQTYIHDFTFGLMDRTGTFFMFLDEQLHDFDFLVPGAGEVMVDTFQLYRELEGAWQYVEAAEHLTFQGYHWPTDFHRFSSANYWIPYCVSAKPNGGFGYLTPDANMQQTYIDDRYYPGASLSYFDSENIGCGQYDNLHCADRIIGANPQIGGYEGSLIYGAFPAAGLENEPIVAFHVDELLRYPGQVGIAITTRSAPMPRTCKGDVNFTGVVNEVDLTICDDAYSGSGNWTDNIICDFDNDGDVDDADIDAIADELGTVCN